MIQAILNYTFNASAKTVTFTDYNPVKLERLVAIKNITTGGWIYQSTDTVNYGGTVATNVLTFTASNAGMNNTDILLIRYDPATSLDTQATSIADGVNIVEGALADAIVAAGATGSISAKLRKATQGLEDLKTLIVLAAGSAVIGKVGIDQTTPGTTNKVSIGTDGDVDVLTQPARVRTTDSISVADQTDAVMSGLTALTPKFAKIDRATNADGAAVVSLVSAKKLRVLKLTLMAAGTVAIKWQSSTSNTTGAGSNTDLTGLISLVANTGMSDSYSPVGLIETVAGEALKLNLNAAIQVSGYLSYIEV